MSLPLEAIRVLDLTRALSGPFCSMILGDLGADVIKVEPTPQGEMIRAWGPFHEGVGVFYLGVGEVFAESDEVAVEDAEAQSDEDPGEDPETNHHRCLRPAAALEVMVHRCGKEDASAEGAE